MQRASMSQSQPQNQYQNRPRDQLENDLNAFEMEPQGYQPDHPLVGQPVTAPSASRIYRFYRSFDEQTQSLDTAGQPNEPLKKDLQGFHSQLIALGSTTGTGLFVGSGRGLAVAGPLPLLAAFAFVGIALCPTVLALGEMATLISVPGGFSEHCRLYTDEAWGGAMGWNYVFQWLITFPLELIAASVILQTWGSPLPFPFIWVIIFISLLLIINVFGVKGYGNVEAVLSILKVAAIIGFVLFGILCDLGLGFHGKALGVKYWYDPGSQRNGFYGFCSVLVTAAFAYSGSEVVGLTANEQENPKRDMPRAIKQVFWRIGIFYICSILLIGVLIPYNHDRLIQDHGPLSYVRSPLIIALEDAGVVVLPHMINVVIIITILSVANSSIYGSSRVLNAMATAGLAPNWFAYVDTKGRPLHCLYLSFFFAMFAFLIELKSYQSTVFHWLLSLCGLSSVISWASICWTHIQFRKALKLHKKALSTLPYESPLGVVGSWIGFVCNCFIVFCQLISSARPVNSEIATMSTAARVGSFFQFFIAIILIFLVFAGFKFCKGTEIQGIELSWRRVNFDNPRIIWGPGTKRINLENVDFKMSWNVGKYILYAQRNPDRVVKVQRLWWCPNFMRGYITLFDFPWRLSDEGELDEKERAKSEEEIAKRWRQAEEIKRQEIEIEIQRGAAEEMAARGIVDARGWESGD